MITGISLRFAFRNGKNEHTLDNLVQNIMFIFVIIFYKYCEQTMMINETTILMNLKDTKEKIKNSKNNLEEFAKLFEKLDVGLVLIKNNMIQF
jgi:hypothetical protein